MKKYHFILIVFLLVCGSPAWAFQAVHDAVLYVHNTVKAVQDELYQQLDLDFQLDQLGTTGEILRTSIDTLNVAKDTYQTVTDVYDTAMNISNYIGDPAKLISYMNSRFWNEHEITAALNIASTALNMSDGAVAATADIEYMLRQVDYAAAEVDINRSRDLAHTQKGAIAVRQFMSEWGPKALLQLQDLNREDQKYNGRDSDLTEMQYATYKNGIWQSNTLGQMFAAQTAHSAMVAQQMYLENSIRDREMLEQAQAIYDSQKTRKAGEEAREKTGSFSGNFIDTFIMR